MRPLVEVLFHSTPEDGSEDRSGPEQGNKTVRDSGTRSMKLTIGMATYDDYDGVYFTVQAVRLYHPEVTEETEILVVDNNPDGPCGDSLRKLADWIPGDRYLLNRDARGKASRDRVFREAQAPYVMCMDSHVLPVPGAFKQLIDYFDTHPDCHDLLQGALVYDDLKSVSTHFEPVWSSGMYGVWKTDERGKDPDHEPFEIPMQGLGLFACRKDAWLGFNPRFPGGGGRKGIFTRNLDRRVGAPYVCLSYAGCIALRGRLARVIRIYGKSGFGIIGSAGQSLAWIRPRWRLILRSTWVQKCLRVPRAKWTQNWPTRFSILMRTIALI